MAEAASLLEEIRTLRRALSCFFSIDALENYMRKVFEDVENSISAEASEIRSKYMKLMSLPLTGGITGVIDGLLVSYGILPEGLRLTLYIVAAVGVVVFALLWYRARLPMLEKLRRFAYQRSFIAGELLSYIRSFAGARFSLESPGDYEQITLMITVSWIALSLFFAESYQIDVLRARIGALVESLRGPLREMLEVLKQKEIYMGLPPEARQPFILLEERLGS